MKHLADLTVEDCDTLEAGPDTDALVAEAMRATYPHHYSITRNAAGKFTDWVCKEHDLWIELRGDVDDDGEVVWECVFGQGQPYICSADAPTEPLARVRAGLKAVIATLEALPATEKEK